MLAFRFDNTAAYRSIFFNAKVNWVIWSLRLPNLFIHIARTSWALRKLNKSIFTIRLEIKGLLYDYATNPEKFQSVRLNREIASVNNTIKHLVAAREKFSTSLANKNYSIVSKQLTTLIHALDDSISSAYDLQNLLKRYNKREARQTTDLAKSAVRISANSLSQVYAKSDR